jgi:DNA helicase II / ATP-dependent DNA helicase PcrA
MISIDIDEWTPQGIDSLEPSGDTVVRSSENTYVIAGPGSGKTELLAQRATFLLQTGTCHFPQNILAICFKRDAVSNLSERVRQRCGSEASRRFHCYTFDAFAKGLLDRFRVALPDLVLPSADYRIVSPENYREIERFLQVLKPPQHLGSRADLGVDGKRFHNKYFVGRQLSASLWENSADLYEWAAAQLWKYRIQALRPSHLTFPMIGRLSQLILSLNPRIMSSLRQTYSHVLLDEFQDTTLIQYSFLRTAFRGSTAIMTAVGDNRQRIMGFAMALKGVFGHFKNDFNACPFQLTINRRSAPELVRIQNFLMKAIDSTTQDMSSADDGKDGAGLCEILRFTSELKEAHYVASYVKKLLDEGLENRDVCILVKQLPDQYAAPLLQTLKDLGIKSRVEGPLQDDVDEPLSQAVLNVLQAAVSKRRAQAWNEALHVLMAVKGFDSEIDDGLQLEELLAAQVAAVTTKIKKQVNSQAALEQLLYEIAAGIGEPQLRLLYPQYQHGSRYRDLLESIAGYLWKSVQACGGDWDSALDDVEGLDALPIMTIHKSKGLEYHTVIFLGLEDQAFWNFEAEKEDNTCAFFVAFSRAKKTVIFTFCEVRANTRDPVKTNTSISSLYQLLHKAGVRERSV